MGYQQFVESHEKDPLDGVEIREDVLAWIISTPEQKVSWIDEAKEHKTSDIILEVSKLSKEYSEGVVTAILEKSDIVDAEKRESLYSKVGKRLKGLSKEDFGKQLKSSDDAIDKLQSVGGKLKNVPLIGKLVKKDLSKLGSSEAGLKVARGMNAVGFSPETSTKTGLKTMVGVHKTKEAVGDARDAVKKFVSGGKEAAEEAGGAIKKFASEHGGKAGAAVGAGLAVTGLAKYLAGKKKKKEQEG